MISVWDAVVAVIGFVLGYIVRQVVRKREKAWESDVAPTAPTDPNRPSFLYNWLGSEGDHNTREVVQDLISRGKTEIPDTFTHKMKQRTRDFARCINAQILNEPKRWQVTATYPATKFPEYDARLKSLAGRGSVGSGFLLVDPQTRDVAFACVNEADARHLQARLWAVPDVTVEIGYFQGSQYFKQQEGVLDTEKKQPKIVHTINLEEFIKEPSVLKCSSTYTLQPDMSKDVEFTMMAVIKIQKNQQGIEYVLAFGKDEKSMETLGFTEEGLKRFMALAVDVALNDNVQQGNTLAIHRHVWKEDKGVHT